MSADGAFGALARVTDALAVPVTADIEAGYGLSPPSWHTRLINAGTVGCNLEDRDHHGEGALVAADRQAQRIHELCEATNAADVRIVVNARIEVYLRQSGTPHQYTEEVVRRARIYLDTGATYVYPIGLTDRDAIDLLVREALGGKRVLRLPMRACRGRAVELVAAMPGRSLPPAAVGAADGRAPMRSPRHCLRSRSCRPRVPLRQARVGRRR